LGITLGTGIGIGIIINGKLFRGSYGMAGEYELSPLHKDSSWSDLIGFKFFQNITKKEFKKNLSPRELFDLSENNNKKAIDIWKKYGENVGLCLCHVIGIINPNYLSIGGGISKAQKYFHKTMMKIIKNKCLVYDNSLITIYYDNSLISNSFTGWIKN